MACFLWSDYEHLVNYCKLGKLDDVRSTKLDTRLMCLLSSYNFPSPFVEAAYCGHFDILKYLLEKYGEHIDINCGARLSIQQGRNRQIMNNVPLFLAACANNNVKMLEYLVSKGADVTKEVPIWGNSLCIAAEYGCISVVKYLLDSGTPINYTNCKGNSPLLIACGSKVSNIDNSTAIIELFISKGADLSQTSVEGYSAMHHAALSDRVRHVQTLLAHGMSPLFAPANPLDDNYIPCPLYVAACNLCFQTVAFLITLPDCLNICKWEVSLIQWKYDIDRKRELLYNSLKYLQDSEIKPIYLDAKITAAYQNHQEMRSLEDIDGFCHTADCTGYAYFRSVCFQGLLIEERMFGLHATDSVAFELQHIKFQIEKGLYKEAELLRQHVFEKCPKQLDLFLGHPLYEDTSTAIEILSWACYGTRAVIHTTWSRKIVAEEMYIPYLKFLKDLLYKIQFYLTKDHLSHVENIIFLYYLSIHAIFANKGRHITVEDLPVQLLSVMEELVRDCLYIAQTSLLHIFLSMCERFFDREDSQCSPYICLIFQCLLKWGDEAIDQPDENDEGKRLLHKSVSLSCSAFRFPLTKILLSNGAHYDAVDGRGLCSIRQSDVDSTNRLTLFYCDAVKVHSIRQMMVDRINRLFHYDVVINERGLHSIRQSEVDRINKLFYSDLFNVLRLSPSTQRMVNPFIIPLDYDTINELEYSIRQSEVDLINRLFHSSFSPLRHTKPRLYIPAAHFFQDISSSYLPLPLSCLTASTIVTEGIEYKRFDLPKRIIEFIALHDPKDATKKLFAS